MKVYISRCIAGLLLLLSVAIALLYYNRKEVLSLDVSNLRLTESSVITVFGAEYTISKSEKPSALLTCLVTNKYVAREPYPRGPHNIRLLDYFPADETRYIRSQLYMDMFQDEAFWLLWTAEHENCAGPFWSDLFEHIHNYRGDDESYAPIFRAFHQIANEANK